MMDTYDSRSIDTVLAEIVHDPVGLQLPVETPVGPHRKRYQPSDRPAFKCGLADRSHSHSDRVHRFLRDALQTDGRHPSDRLFIRNVNGFRTL